LSQTKFAGYSITSSAVARSLPSHGISVERPPGLSCVDELTWLQSQLDLPDNYFDGVFANASLFHVPSQELSRVLLELRACLKPGGVLFSSNPRGHNQEGWSDGRYGAYYDLETWRRFVPTAGFTELTHYYRPAGLPPERQPLAGKPYGVDNRAD
jgi:SAM-dependent methyltransferase